MRKENFVPDDGQGEHGPVHHYGVLAFHDNDLGLWILHGTGIFRYNPFFSSIQCDIPRAHGRVVRAQSRPHQAIAVGPRVRSSPHLFLGTLHS